jgi:hypothetical protein
MQAHAAEGVLAQTMSGFVAATAPRIDAFRESLPTRKRELRAQAIAAEQTHSRTPDIVANLMIGLEVFLEFAKNAGAIGEEQASQLWHNGWNAILDASRKQAGHVQSEDPSRRFFELLVSAVLSGMCHLAGKDGKAPENPAQWGWRESVVGEGTAFARQEVKPQGRLVGWVDSGSVYLDMPSAFAVAQQLGAQQGQPFPIGEKTLAQRILEKKLVVSNEGGHSTNRLTLAGARRRVLHIAVATLMPDNEPAEISALNQ